MKEQAFKKAQQVQEGAKKLQEEWSKWRFREVVWLGYSQRQSPRRVEISRMFFGSAF